MRLGLFVLLVRVSDMRGGPWAFNGKALPFISMLRRLCIGHEARKGYRSLTCLISTSKSKDLQMELGHV
jgi:hypothetical protein